MKTSIIVAIVVAMVTIMLQQTLTKIIIGISIKTAKPFKVGDSIIVHQGVAEIASGKVISIGLMRTKIKSYERNVFIIPNSLLDNCVITNIDYVDGINHIETIQLDITKQKDLDNIIDIVSKILIGHPMTDNTEDNTKITYKINGDKILITYNVRTPDISSSFDVCSDITRKILNSCSNCKILLG